MSELLLGVDIGTSSSKGVIARPDGEVVATAERPHDLSMPRPGWAEHDAEGVWWADFVSVCRELLEVADAGVAAVCTSGIGACLLPADEDGRPLRPAILYGIDTRAVREIEELNERYGRENLLERCGSVLTTQAVGPKLLWLRRNEPEVWDETAMFFMANSFIAWRLTGEYVLDHHSASQCDPLYDVHSYRWIGEWAEEIAPGLPLPRLLWPAEVVGEVTQQAAQVTGIPAGTPVAAGTIDAWSEGASVGVQEPGDLMLMYGTTMFMIEVLREPLNHPGLWGTTGILPNTHNLAAGMATSGALTGWLKKISGDLLYETLTEEAATVAPGSEALVVLPYFVGERTPLFDPRARGVISGLTLSHGRSHLYRAMLEATAYGVRHIFEFMRDAGGGGRGSWLSVEEQRGACGPRSSPTSPAEHRTSPSRPSGRATVTPCWPHVPPVSRSRIQTGARSLTPSSPKSKTVRSTTSSIVSTEISTRPPARRRTLSQTCRKEEMSSPERKAPIAHGLTPRWRTVFPYATATSLIVACS